MRHPTNSDDNTLLCVNCKEPERGEPPNCCDHNSSDKSHPRKVNTNALEDSNKRLSVSTASDLVSGGASTPPTDVTPPPSPPFVLPPPSEEMIRRRAQSDRASQEIGNRMLRGWTMLADECINTSCHGIPLMRSPGGNPIKAQIFLTEFLIKYSNSFSGMCRLQEPLCPRGFLHDFARKYRYRSWFKESGRLSRKLL